MSSSKLILEILFSNPFIIVYLISIYLASTILKQKSDKAAQYVIVGCILGIIISSGRQYLYLNIYESGLVEMYGEEIVMQVYRLGSTLLSSVSFFIILAAAFVDRDNKNNDPYANQSVFS